MASATHPSAPRQAGGAGTSASRIFTKPDCPILGDLPDRGDLAIIRETSGLFDHSSSRGPACTRALSSEPD
jgi:hypothetical protein